MRHARIALLLAWLALPVLALGACSDDEGPTSPVPVTALHGKKSSTTTKTITSTTPTVTKETDASWLPLLRDEWSWADIFDTETIGPSGGTLQAGEVTLTIPRGALSEDTKIYMVALQGDKVYALFYPEGLQFQVPATLSIAVDKTNAKDAPASDLLGVYFKSLFDDTPSPLESYSINKKGTVVSFQINHFSYYSVLVRRGYTAAGAD